MTRARAQGLEPEPVQQVLDGLEAANHAELVLQDSAHVLAAQGADPVGLGRPGAESVLELLLLIVSQGLVAPAPGSVDQGIDPARVVPCDPGAHRPLREQHLLGDVGCGVTEQGQSDGTEAPSDSGAGFGADALGQLVGGVVRLDVRGGLLRDTARL